MDDALIRFRQAAERENRHRRMRRRYSLDLQRQALEYWQQRRDGDGLRTIAMSLGVAPTTLQRWTRATARRSRFRPVEVSDPKPWGGTHGASVVIHVTPTGPRVEGLTVDTAARLLTLLR